MKYTTLNHTALQIITAKAKRARKWMRIQVISKAIADRATVHHHVGIAY